jgi:hypothetical protein
MILLPSLSTCLGMKEMPTAYIVYIFICVVLLIPAWGYRKGSYPPVSRGNIGARLDLEAYLSLAQSLTCRVTRDIHMPSGLVGSVSDSGIRFHSSRSSNLSVSVS